MFDFDNQDRIQLLIQRRKEDAYITPLYVKIFDRYYSMNQLSEITDFNLSAYKIGFGADYSLFDKHSFPIQLIDQFDCVKTFEVHDEDTDVATRYYVLETFYSRDGEYIHKEGYNVIHNQIQYYSNMLTDYLIQQYESIRKKRLEELMNS